MNNPLADPREVPDNKSHTPCPCDSRDACLHTPRQQCRSRSPGKCTRCAEKQAAGRRLQTVAPQLARHPPAMRAGRSRCSRRALSLRACAARTCARRCPLVASLHALSPSAEPLLSLSMSVVQRTCGSTGPATPADGARERVRRISRGAFRRCCAASPSST